MVNTNKLKGLIKEKEFTQADIAKHLGIAPPTVSQKLNNIRAFDLEEAEKLSKLLGIEAGDFGKYFFCLLSCILQQERSRIGGEFL